jgi:hypothetical protein
MPDAVVDRSLAAITGGGGKFAGGAGPLGIDGIAGGLPGEGGGVITGGWGESTVAAAASGVCRGGSSICTVSRPCAGAGGLPIGDGGTAIRTVSFLGPLWSAIQPHVRGKIAEIEGVVTPELHRQRAAGLRTGGSPMNIRIVGWKPGYSGQGARARGTDGRAIARQASRS